MSIIQLTELIPMVTPLGDGYAIILETTSQDYHWTIILDNGALVTFTQDKVRAASSYSHGRGIDDKRMRKIIKGVPK